MTRYQPALPSAISLLFLLLDNTLAQKPTTSFLTRPSSSHYTVHTHTYTATHTSCNIDPSASVRTTVQLAPTITPGLPPGAECWRVLSASDNVAEVPILSILPDGATFLYDGSATSTSNAPVLATGLRETSSPAAASALAAEGFNTSLPTPETRKKNDLLKLVGIVIGSILSALLLGGTLLYLINARRLRHRASGPGASKYDLAKYLASSKISSIKHGPHSRVRAWISRPGGGSMIVMSNTSLARARW